VHRGDFENAQAASRRLWLSTLTRLVSAFGSQQAAM
jgi:hypothetical protein